MQKRVLALALASLEGNKLGLRLCSQLLQPRIYQRGISLALLAADAGRSRLALPRLAPPGRHGRRAARSTPCRISRPNMHGPRDLKSSRNASKAEIAGL